MPVGVKLFASTDPPKLRATAQGPAGVQVGSSGCQGLESRLAVAIEAGKASCPNNGEGPESRGHARGGVLRTSTDDAVGTSGQQQESTAAQYQSKLAPA
jgi:hypothetical protein